LFLPIRLSVDRVMDFEELGLSLYQSRVLITLIKYGKAKTSDIAQLSGVPRAEVYSVLDQLKSGKTD